MKNTFFHQIFQLYGTQNRRCFKRPANLLLQFLLLLLLPLFWGGTQSFGQSLPAEPLPGEKVLYSWDFETDGDLEGWRDGGQIKDLRVEEGALKATYTGRDPILFLPPVEFQTKPGLIIEIRMKNGFQTSGELFFSNTKEGPYGGFSGAKSKSWKIPGSGEFHTERFLPGWLAEGKIIQLRLDPGTPSESHFGKEEFAIDSVKIIDLNYDSIPFFDGEWKADDSNFLAHWKPANANVRKTSKGLSFSPLSSARNDSETPQATESQTRIRPQTPQLQSRLMRLKDGEFRCWCAIEMAVSKGMAGRLIFTADSLKESFEVPIPIQPDGKMRTYNVPILNPNFNPAKVHSALLEMSDSPEAQAVVKSIRFTSEPQGPARLDLCPGGGLTDALCRAGRPLAFEFLLSNSGGETAKNLKISKFILPEGVTLTESQFPHKAEEAVLESFDSLTCKFKIQSLKSVSGTVKVEIQFEDGVSAKPVRQEFEFPIEILPSLNLPKASYVPEPKPLKSEYEIGALYFPGWGTPAAWERIFPVAPIRKPVLGWYDERNPECIDWQIKWAVENGIQYFLVDWYWNRGSQHLDHWVKGFQKARYRSYMKWALMWANHNGAGSHSEEDQANVTRFWIENYFCTPEYYQIEGKPVVMIWSPDGMDRDLREIYAQKGIQLKKGEGVKKLLDLSRKMAKEAGFKGIYFISMKWPEASTNPQDVQWLADAGFDMTSLYHFMDHGGKAPNPKYFSFDHCVDAIGPYLEKRWETGILPFLPNLATGWDSRPWHGLRQTVIYDRTPEKFRKICEICKEFTQKSGQRNIVLAPLNEWGEGSYAEPNKEFGFEMYEAVRETFCEKPAEGWPLNYSPADVGLGPYDFNFTKPDLKQMLNVSFDDPNAPSPWNSLMGISDFEISDGKLTFKTTSVDPAIQARFENLFANRCSKIVIRLRILPTEGTLKKEETLQLFWGTQLLPISESSSLRVSIPIDGEFHECTFPVASSSFWMGKISNLRFDPGNVKGVKVEIDFIRLEK